MGLLAPRLCSRVVARSAYTGGSYRCLEFLEVFRDVEQISRAHNVLGVHVECLSRRAMRPVNSFQRAAKFREQPGERSPPEFSADQVINVVVST